MKKIDTDKTLLDAVTTQSEDVNNLLTSAADAEELAHIERISINNATVEIRTTDRTTFEKLISTQLWTQDAINNENSHFSGIEASAIDDALSSFSDEETWAEVEAAFAELSQETAAIINLVDGAEAIDEVDEMSEMDLKKSQLPAAKTLIDDSPEDEPIVSVVAAAAAPWFGAEDSWRSGMPQLAKSNHSDSQPDFAVPRNSLAGLELTSEELQTVRTSLPPPPDELAAEQKVNPWKGISLAAMLVIVVLTTWVVAQERQAPVMSDSPQLNAAVSADNAIETAPALQEPVVPVTEVASVEVPAAEESWNFTLEESMTASDSSETRVKQRHNKADERTDEVENNAIGDNSADEVPSAEKNDSATVETDGAEHSESTAVAADVEEEKDAASEVASAGATEEKADNASEPTDAAVMGALREMLKSEASAEPQHVEVRNVIPELPSKVMIKQAMEKIAPSVSRCKMNQSGRLVVKLVVAGDTGRVISSQVVDNAFQGTSTGLCAARAVQMVKLPAFQKDKLIIKYPFEI